MKDVKIRVSADTAQAEKSVKDLNKETKNLTGSVDEAGDATAGLTGQLDKMTGGAVTAFNGMKSGLKSAIKGFKTLKGAIIATGLGALVVVIAALVTSFKTSEEGQNRWAKAMGMLGAITGVVTDGISALGTLIIDVFTKPGKVFKDFKDSIKTYVIDQIAIVTDGLGLLGSAIKKAFSGDFSGALDDAGAGLKKLYIEANPLVQATKALAGATKDLVKEMTNEARIAGKIADMRAKADKLDRALIVERAEANRKRAELLEKAVDKEKYTTKERIEFLKEAGKVEDDITQKEIASAQLRLDAKIAENALGLSTKEDMEEEANLRATLINLETAKLTKAKEVTSQIIALNAEETASLKAKSDEAKTLAEEKEVQRVADELKRQENEQKMLESRLQYLRDKGDEELAIANAVEQAKRDMQDATLMHIKGGIGILAQLSGESKALQAVTLIAEHGAGIAETAMGAAKSIAQRKAAHNAIPLMIGTTYNVAKGIDGVGMIKDIASTKLSAGLGIATQGVALAKGLSALGGGGGGSSAPSIGGGSESGGSSAPSFNLVEGTESNAVQNSINNQGGKPVKAYVTSGDVTTAQQADRQAELNSGF